MKSFINHVIEKQNITRNILQMISKISEYKGMQNLYKKQSPQILKTLLQIATIQSTESSNKIEGIIVPHERIVSLVTKRKKPKNRSEEEILGYKYVLNLIHNNHQNIPFKTNIILQFHKDLYKYATVSAGKWKNSDNTIEEILPNGKRLIRFKPLSAFQTPDAMNQLQTSFNKEWERGNLHKLLLIATYILDFLCIHPFLDGNGRLSRLLTLMLLYHSDYYVGQYISIEKIIEDTKEEYYSALQKSSQSWHEGKHDLNPWWEYFLAIILEAYKSFEERVGYISKGKGSKTGIILETIDSFQNEFTIQDIQKNCPVVGIDLIRKTLARLKKRKKIACIGRGPMAKWKKMK